MDNTSDDILSPKKSKQNSSRKLRSSGSHHSRNRYSDQGVFYPDYIHIRDERRPVDRERQKVTGAQTPPEQSGPEMSGRPRNRGAAGRDGAKENDVEADVLARIIDGLKQAQKHNEESRIIGEQIMSLEQDIKDAGHSTPDQHKQLDHLYRSQMRLADAEKKTLDDMYVINSIAILQTLQSSDEPAPRNGVPKSRKGGARPIVEPDIIESPGPSPNEGRAALMNRIKGTGQRSSSVASQNRTTVKEESLDTNRGVQAERAGQLVVGLEVFYKFPKGSKEVEGEGIHGIIKKVLQSTKPIQYEVHDPETDQSGKQIIRKAVAKELVPIPSNTATLPVFTTGSRVYAKYPDTDTFYNAEVRNFSKGTYTLMFEGEEDNRELTVDKKFVLDARVR